MPVAPSQGLMKLNKTKWMRWEWRNGGIKFVVRENRRNPRKPTQTLFCSPQIPHGVTKMWTWYPSGKRRASNLLNHGDTFIIFYIIYAFLDSGKWVHLTIFSSHCPFQKQCFVNLIKFKLKENCNSGTGCKRHASLSIPTAISLPMI